MKTKIIRRGKSFGVHIPRPAIEKARLKEGDLLEIEAQEGQIRLRLGSKAPTLARLVAQITEDNRYSMVSTGTETGKEMIEW